MHGKNDTVLNSNYMQFKYVNNFITLLKLVAALKKGYGSYIYGCLFHMSGITFLVDLKKFCLMRTSGGIPVDARRKKIGKRNTRHDRLTTSPNYRVLAIFSEDLKEILFNKDLWRNSRRCKSEQNREE